MKESSISLLGAKLRKNLNMPEIINIQWFSIQSQLLYVGISRIPELAAHLPHIQFLLLFLVLKFQLKTIWLTKVG